MLIIAVAAGLVVPYIVLMAALVSDADERSKASRFWDKI